MRNAELADHIAAYANNSGHLHDLPEPITKMYPVGSLISPTTVDREGICWPGRAVVVFVFAVDRSTGEYAVMKNMGEPHVEADFPGTPDAYAASVIVEAIQTCLNDND